MKHFSQTFLLILFLLTLVSEGATAAENESLFNLKRINTIEFWCDNDSLWDDMALEYRKKTKKYFNVKSEINGLSFKTTGIRFKGNHSYAFAWTDKKPLKVKIDAFEKQDYFGVKKFNLANAFEDPSFQRDIQSLEIMRKMGVPAPLASYAKVFLNGEYIGLYILIEQLDKPFIRRHFGEDSGPLFESNGFCLSEGSAKNLELKENKKGFNDSVLTSFITFFKNSNDLSFFQKIEGKLNVSSFLNACAVDVYLGNRDSYAWGRCHNFYLYFNKNGVAEWIAWDYNLSFGYEGVPKEFYPIKSLRNEILNRLLENDKYLSQYWAAIHKVSKLTSSCSFKRSLKRNYRSINGAVKADKNSFYDYDTFKLSLDKTITGGLATKIPGLRAYVKNRKHSWKEFKKESGLRFN